MNILIDPPVSRYRGGYDHVRVYELPDGRRLRTSIHVDFYDFQSRVYTELWDGTQWHRVLWWPGAQEPVSAMPPSVAGPQALTEACNALSELMLAETLKVVVTPLPAQQVTSAQIAQWRALDNAEPPNPGLAWGDLADIQGAFEQIDPATLPEPAENATISDMLDELEARVPAFAWHGWEAEPEMTGDGEGDPDKYFITITHHGEEYALIVHRTCGGDYPLDGVLATQKQMRADDIVAALNQSATTVSPEGNRPS